MLVVMERGSASRRVADVLRVCADLGLEGRVVSFHDRQAVSVSPATRPVDPSLFERLPGVQRVLALTHPTRRAARENRRGDTVVRVGGRTIGGGEFTLIAGPCAVENEEQIVSVARSVHKAGADLLRGGAYKPRTSPYSFQGLGREGLRLLAMAREETGLPVVTEALDEASLELVVQFGDVVQIGARNMQNFSLLRQVGRCPLPVFLKRGMAASLDDLLMAAEYVLGEGNPNVILCERGIRTFADHSRYTLDLSVIPAVHELSHLPIFVDPSHGTGVHDYVAPMARAAVGAGADGLMLEVHSAPQEALCDGPQALHLDEFAALAPELRDLARLVSGRTETVP